MLPYITIFGREIATYGLTIFIGIFIGAIIAVQYFTKFHDIKKDDVIFAILYAVIGVGVGAKLLYIITNIPFLIENYNSIDIWDTLMQMFKGGFVFYGGLIGGIIGVFIYAKQFKISFKSLVLILIPVVPLIHAIGRIGCLLAGCCYGMEYHGFGAITFEHSLLAPNGVPLFPMQIVESICNFIIFIVLLVTYKKFLGTYKTVGLYLILYSIVRFVLEFFRGDLIRGIYFGLSTSQWISILLVIVGIAIFANATKKKNGLWGHSFLFKKLDKKNKSN